MSKFSNIRDIRAEAASAGPVRFDRPVSVPNAKDSNEIFIENYIQQFEQRYKEYLPIKKSGLLYEVTCAIMSQQLTPENIIEIFDSRIHAGAKKIHITDLPFFAQQQKFAEDEVKRMNEMSKAVEGIAICPGCEKKTLNLRNVNLRSGDEGATEMYICGSCNYKSFKNS